MIGYQECLFQKQTGKTLIRLLLQKQSDLGLSCLSRHFDTQAATSFGNFRTFTIIVLGNQCKKVICILETQF